MTLSPYNLLTRALNACRPQQTLLQRMEQDATMISLGRSDRFVLANRVQPLRERNEDQR